MTGEERGGRTGELNSLGRDTHGLTHCRLMDSRLIIDINNLGGALFKKNHICSYEGLGVEAFFYFIISSIGLNEYFYKPVSIRKY